MNTALRFDRKGALRFAALQSGAGKELLKRSGRSPEDISSIVLVEPDSSHIKSEAILRIGKYLELPFPVLVQFGFPFPLFFRDTIYDQVSSFWAEHTCTATLEMCMLLSLHAYAAGCEYSLQGLWPLDSL